MALPIYIPEPCHEDWQQMTPADKGKHCAACNKIVVDFSEQNPDEILAFLKANLNVCGRFKQSQISRPTLIDHLYNGWQYIQQMLLSPIKRIALAILLVFQLAACNDDSFQTTGEIIPIKDLSNIDTLTNEQVDSFDVVLGEFVSFSEPEPEPIKCVEKEDFVTLGMAIPRILPDNESSDSLKAIDSIPFKNAKIDSHKIDSLKIRIPKEDSVRMPLDITK